MPTPDEILARIENSPHATLLHDEQALEQTLIALMAASEHPVLAEMGHELAQGNISWQGLAGIPAYQDVLAAGIATMQQIDLDEVAAGLAAPGPAARDTEPEDEPEELFRGLDHEQR